MNPPGDAHKMPKRGILARRTVSAAGAQTYSKDSILSQNPSCRFPGTSMNERGVPVNPPGDAHKMPKRGILARRTVSVAGAQTYSKDSILSRHPYE